MGKDCTVAEASLVASRRPPSGLVYKLGIHMKNNQTLAPQKVALRFSVSERGNLVRVVRRRKFVVSGRRVVSEHSSTQGSASVVVSVFADRPLHPYPQSPRAPHYSTTSDSHLPGLLLKPKGKFRLSPTPVDRQVVYLGRSYPPQHLQRWEADSGGSAHAHSSAPCRGPAGCERGCGDDARGAGSGRSGGSGRS